MTKMETKSSKKSTSKDYRKIIIEGYKAYVLEDGHSPASIYKFSKELKMKEEEFYTYFTSFEGIKSAIWVEIFEDTLADIEKQGVFADYSAREKFLGFLFTWIEVLKKNRSLLLCLYQDKTSTLTTLPKETSEFKKRFKDFAKQIILEGKETTEIAERPYLSDKYDEAMWFQIWFVFRFWIDDQSTNFEKTDAAIEKSVNLAFDLMGQTALDSFIDFAKFMYQSK